MYTVNPLPRRTLSPTARRLHSLLRSHPGYEEAAISPRKVAWTLEAISQLPCHQLPAGCIDAVSELKDALGFFAPKLIKLLTVEHLCKIIADLSFYCYYRNAEEAAFEKEQGKR